MRAAVCYEFGQPLVIDEVELDEPGRGEVRVKIAAVAICHSDVHLIRGEWGGELPVVAGHEAAGIVDAVGEGVDSVQPGDHVIVSLLRSCGHCFYCTTGSPYVCESQFPLRTETRLHTPAGEPILQGINCGAFAEYAVVHQSQLVLVDDELPLDSLALLACGVITGAGAVINTGGVRPGESVAVIGTGGVGLNAVQGAALAGANPIIALDLLDSKLEAARAFGATHALNAADPELPARVRALTGGRGPDYAVVTVGSVAAIEQALRLVRREGTVVVAGMPHVDASFALPVYRFVGSGRRIVGSVMGSTRLHVDVPRFVELYQQGRLKLDQLISNRYPLESINAAIESMESGQALRNVIVFD
ncbi:MAG TPA: Zn-dependent alcohol dehydrogenase [Nitrolancea sp.]|nr:Zn-dependent alcohol dehydrogenase [Nitrolancea sp.]